MAQAAPAPAATRLAWLDGIKGLAILWIVFFHLFGTYAAGRYPSPLGKRYFASFLAQCAPASALATVRCVFKASFVAVTQMGFHGVGVFVVMSGFGLCYSLAQTGQPRGGWAGWYRARVLRLFPVYWVAHLLYLVSPFQARLEPVDYRFILSFLGDRVYPIYTIFYYLNPAWWYFGLIIELYLVFPFLFRLLQRVGAVPFLILCGLETVVSRYLLLFVIPASGYYLQGAFCGCRLWEFALGMVVGVEFRRRRAETEQWIFSAPVLLGGIAVYTLGLYSYDSMLAYTLTDALTGTGLTILLARVALLSERLPRVGAALAYVGVYCYGLYLFHQPYVIYFGERMRGLGPPAFVALACVLIAILTMGAIVLERLTNRLARRLFEPAHPALEPGAVSQGQPV